MTRDRIYLLSPANLSGRRGQSLLREDSRSEFAQRLRDGNVTLGEAFTYISGLYFRGKMSYTQAFAAPPKGLPGAFIIVSSRGLVPPNVMITTSDLRSFASTPIDAADPQYRVPLENACRRLRQAAGAQCDFVFLGSVATSKYVDPLFGVFGERLLFPQEFAGRGDLSRGGLMLCSVREGQPLTYVPLGKAARYGARPPKLAKLR